MPGSPESYLDNKRPPLIEALHLEGGVSIREAMDSLTRKGYFTPPPRPWQVGVEDRGMGRQSFVILDKFEDLVVEAPSRETAEFIVSAANAQR